MTGLVVSTVVLWLVVIGLSVALLAVVRQLGVLHERIAPVGALMLAKGLKIGELAPKIQAQDLEGRPISLGSARTDERATLIMFVSPTCPVCKTLVPILRSSLASERDWLDIILASDGEAASQREFVLAHRHGGFPYVVSAPARGIVNAREHLESLFEAKRLGFASIQEYFETAARNQAA
jgi:methylamine dehydrogenase accessory protein MauD